jgi:hypothetical protein
MDEERGARRLWLWPTISPRGLKPPEPALYLTWPGWERHRTLKLGQAASYPDLAGVEIGEPAGFGGALAALAEAALDGGRPDASPPFSDHGALSIRQALLGRPPGQAAGRAHLLVALWSAAASSWREAEAKLAEAQALHRTMLASLSGDEAPVGDPAWPAGPPPTAPAPAVARGWLELAAPVLGPRDVLWSPWGGLAEEIGLREIDPWLSLPPA